MTDHERRRRYWLWVTGPDYYVEDYDPDTGEWWEREMLDPKISPGVQGWWTCHRDTQPGDMVLLYRTSPMTDVAYVIETATNAFSLPDKEVPVATWQWGCNFRVLAKFEEPITWREIKVDPVLSNWGVTRSGPRRQVFEIPEEYWDRFVELLVAREPALHKPLRTRNAAPPKRRHEEWLEGQLISNLKPLKALGFDIRGARRQVHCAEINGRVDILCQIGEADWLVVELKARTAQQKDLTQTAAYLAWVRDQLAEDGATVRGLLVAPDFDAKTRASASMVASLELATWAESGRSIALKPVD